MNWTQNTAPAIGRRPHDGKRYRPPGIADKPGCERAHPPYEKTGVIAGYTVVLGDAEPKSHIDALISISVAPADRQYFITMVENQPGVAQCFHVTGSHSFIVKVKAARASMSWSILSTVFRSWGRRAPRIDLIAGPALY